MKLDKITPQIAALYLGQKCEKKDYGVCFFLADVNLWHVTDGDRIIANFENITLHLRRLDSITEDEARELYEMEHDKQFSSDTYKSAKAFLQRDDEMNYFRPTTMLYLLGKGFDLFGLIDAGLAKDVSQTTQTK